VVILIWLKVVSRDPLNQSHKADPAINVKRHRSSFGCGQRDI
jgi:hypothetical protein